MVREYLLGRAVHHAGMPRGNADLHPTDTDTSDHGTDDNRPPVKQQRRTAACKLTTDDSRQPVTDLTPPPNPPRHDDNALGNFNDPRNRIETFFPPDQHTSR